MSHNLSSELIQKVFYEIMSNQMKVDFLEAVTKDNDGLGLGNEYQKEIQTVEREIFIGIKKKILQA